jgi:alanine-synthesizing transaminase
VRYSDRLPRDIGPNTLTRTLEALRARGVSVTDLTVSNPTTVDLDYPKTLLEPLSSPAGFRYEPQPFGHRRAREAVAADCARRGARVSPEQVVLSASTSESYSWLFKLLCNPGDSVLVPSPSYPLFEHLTRLEGVEATSYRLEYHGRWEIDLASVAAAPRRTRAVLLVSPNNPTGSFVSPRELDALTTICRERGWAIVADEVFADYVLEAGQPLTDIAARADVLAFTLGGLSKSVGLPQLKLGWIIVGGPDAARQTALNGLELIADTFLSVGTPVQLAAEALLAGGAVVRDAILGRIRGNLKRARDVVARYPSCELLPVEGAWSAIARVPATRTEESLVVDLLTHEQVLVHPGYFFDFDREAFIVFSLLPPEAVLTDALGRVLRFASSAASSAGRR